MFLEEFPAGMLSECRHCKKSGAVFQKFMVFVLRAATLTSPQVVPYYYVTGDQALPAPR
jgi:hypothetical protein